MADDTAGPKVGSPEDAMDVDPKPVASIENDPNQEDEGEDDNEDAASDGEDNGSRPVSNQLYKGFKSIADLLTNYKIKIKHRNTEEDHYPSTLFKRLPNKRNLPDYYSVITRPSALSTLKGKIQRKQYTGVAEFVEDFALIVHNAQVYNRPNSAPVRDVIRLDAIFKEEMKKLVEQGLVTEEQTAYPDLGEIPYATPEPDPVSEDEEDADEEQDEDDDDELDDSDDDRRKKRGRRGRASIGGRKADKDDDDEDGDKAADAEQKRRGRPPKVDTPMEARIKAILKGLRKYRNNDGLSLIHDFEKLPDKIEHPQYYAVIQNPMALDGIKKKAKRKKYQTVDQFMKDVTTMFENALLYNEDGSIIHTNAQELLEEAQGLAKAEKDKPDSEYLMQDGRLPLPYINYNNKAWRVGDWIHLQNPNDVTKPIVAQIYRTWQDPDERKWINACWYYRPEQTVHQYEKHFFPNEVVKTGQYRDHPIEEVIDRCFVMFFTRYGKGRPRGLDPSDEVYVCESRYNEDKFKFNKIKTWASCLPDEVRDKDYEMDLFDIPRKVKKVPSPLLYMLKEDAKENDELPQPIWGNPNAPPKQGGIHKRPRDENQSPPPEPTPPPPPTPPPVVRQPSSSVVPQQSQQGLARLSSGPTNMPSQLSGASQSIPPQTPFSPSNATPTTQYSRQSFQTGAPQNSYGMSQAATQGQGQSTPYGGQQPTHQAPGYGSYGVGHTAATPTQNYPRQTIQAYQAQQAQQSHPQPYSMPYSANIAVVEGRQKEVYVLSDAANDSIPKEVRDLYPQDDQGKVLWFTQPPIYASHMIEDRLDSRGKGQPLQHTEKYLQAKELRDELRTKKTLEMEAQDANKIAFQQNSLDQRKRDHNGMTNGENSKRIRLDEAAIKRSSDEVAIAFKKLRGKIKMGQDERSYVVQSFWTGKYLDDYDPRLPPFN